ncbi:MAG: carboxypeptidase regulatory-like domain-containing protein [Planctomycetota bacterium]
MPAGLPVGTQEAVEAIEVATGNLSGEPANAIDGGDDDDEPAQDVVLVGRLVDAAGRPAEGAEVRFLASGLEALATAVVRSELQRDRGDNGDGAGTDFLASRVAAADADGRFELVVPMPKSRDASDGMGEMAWILSGSAQLAATHRGLATTTHPCPPLAPGEVDVGTIVMEAGAWIHGTAVDARGRPVSGAWASAVSQAEGQDSLGSLFDQLLGPSAMLAQVETHADGSFEVGGLRPGRARLVLATPGLRPAQRADVDLRPYAGTDVGRVVLADGETIAGIVTDADGVALPGAEVESDTDAAVGKDMFTLPLAMMAHLTPEVTTDAEGRFLLTGLVAGEHEVRGSGEGFLDTAHPDVPTGTTDLHLVLERPEELAVLVVSEGDGEPLADVFMTAQLVETDGSLGDELLVTSPESPGAPHRIAGAGRDGASLEVRAASFAGARVVTTSLPAAGGMLVLALRPESVVFGTVVDEEGGPVTDATVRLAPVDGSDADDRSGGSELRFTTGTTFRTGGPGGPRRDDGGAGEGPLLAPDSVGTEDDGSFRIAGLGTGAWRLAANAPSHTAARLDLGVVEAGEQRGPVTLVLAAAGRLVGGVAEADGSPVAGALLVVAPGGLDEVPGLGDDGLSSLAAATALSGSIEERMQSLHRATTGADGAWSVDGLAPGPYTVTMRPPGMSVASLLTYTGLDTDAGADAVRAVQVIAREETRVDFVRAARATIHGRVLAGGAGAAGAQVRLLEGTTLLGIEIPLAARTASCDRDGAYRFEDVEPGPYKLAATVAAAALDKTVEVEALPGRTVLADLVLGSARVTGRVVDRVTGEGVPGVPVTIAAEDSDDGGLLDGLFGDSVTIRVNVDVEGSQTERREAALPDAGVTTDADGAFELAFLDPGRYSVSTGAGDWTPAESEVFELAAGATHGALRLEVERAATLAGRVTLAGGGDPLPLQEVRVTGADGQIETTRTDGDGRWELPGLPPGDYTVTLPSGGLFGGSKARSELTLAGGERREVDFRVSE